ncbi:MAG: dTMP kinase [Halobacteriaceae archaeon]
MLVTLEGIDGSGKTTAWDHLRETRVDAATFTREPTESWYGDAVRRSIDADDADPLAELFLYTADHADHLSRRIRPALERGETVVSDRYSDSRYAYQAVALDGVVEDPMAYVKRVHEPWTRPPDRTLYFDVDAETGAERAGVTNKFETAEFLREVRERYEDLRAAEPERFVRIDGHQPLPDVLDDVEDALADVL